MHRSWRNRWRAQTAMLVVAKVRGWSAIAQRVSLTPHQKGIQRIPARLLVIQNLSTSSSVLRVAGAHCASADAVATTEPRRCSSPPLRRCAACVGDGNTVANPLSLEEAVAAAPLRRCTAFVYRPACLSSTETRPGTRKALSTSD